MVFIIPIQNKIYKYIFSTVLIIENWEELNQELLDSTIEEYKTKTFNYDKLTLSYWQKLIKCYNI